MANVQGPFGLRPVRTGLGSPWNGQVTMYCGDLLEIAAGCDADGVPYIAKAEANDTIRGVLCGVKTDPLNLNIVYIPATKTHDYYVFVCDDPDAVFEIQDDGITTANLVSTAVGKNADFTVATPTAPVPTSATVLLSSSIATTNTLPLKIVGLKLVPGQTIGAYATWLVRLNKSDFNGQTAGI